MHVIPAVEQLVVEQGRQARARGKKRRGMTLIEIMVVITLLGMIAAAVGVAAMNMLENGQIDTARTQAMELAKAMDTYKSIDIIVNNAGYTWDNVIQKMEDAQWDAILDVHLKAPFRILRAASAFIDCVERHQPAPTGRQHRG